MGEKRAKKATEEAKEAQANEQIRRKSAKVCGLSATDWRICLMATQGHWQIARRAQGEGKLEGNGKEETR
jgi:hypothetical protein